MLMKFCVFIFKIFLFIDYQTINYREIVVETYKRGTTERMSTTKNAENGVIIRSTTVDDKTIFNFFTFVYDGGNSRFLVLIFASKQFNIGCQPMGKRVMLYLIDHPNTIFVVSFGSPAQAATFYNIIKAERSENGDMLSVEEMVIIIFHISVWVLKISYKIDFSVCFQQTYDRSEIATMRMAK